MRLSKGPSSAMSCCLKDLLLATRLYQLDRIGTMTTQPSPGCLQSRRLEQTFNAWVSG